MKFNGNGKVYEKPSVGSVAAVCVRIIDLGTHDITGKYGTKKKHQVRISWEIDEKMKDGKPFLVSKTYTKTLHEKGMLRPDLESWRGKAFTQEELEAFDDKKILGKPCLLNLVENGEYINIKAISPLPKGMSAPSPVGTPFTFSLAAEEFDQKIFDSLSETTKAKITLSPEYQALKGIASQVGEDAPPAEDEQVPF